MKEWPRIRIRKPKGVTGSQIGLALFLGIVGGYYIWRPLIIESTRALSNKPILESSEKST